MQLIIFGAPGAGKGTQSKILSKKFNLLHISTGDLLRTEVSKETELGLQAKEILDRGELVPDEIVANMVVNALKDAEKKDGFILDGFPRTVNQAKMLYNILNDLNIEFPTILFLNVEQDVIVKRLSRRRQCLNCLEIFNLKVEETPEYCPKCGEKGTLHRRKDDEEDVVRKRLNIYYENTSPVLDFYKTKDVNIVEVIGTKPIEQVTREIIEKVNAVKNVKS